MANQDFLPLHERQAARAALEHLVEKLGSQTAVGAALDTSQPSINKAILYSKIGPGVMRSLLEYLQIDIKELLTRHGDPSKPLSPPSAPRSHKEEAIIAGVRYGNVREADARAIADAYETVLKDAPLVEWIETMMREIQKRHLTPAREEKAATRRRKTQQRILRNLNDAHAQTQNEPAPAGEEKRRSTR